MKHRLRFINLALAFVMVFGALGFMPKTTVEAQTDVVVINEIDYDQDSTDINEYIEIKNIGTSSVDLADYSLEMINGNGDGASIYATIDLPATTLAAGDYYVVCANAATVANCDLDVSPDTNLIQNGSPDAVALRRGTALLDTVSYEGNTGAPYTEDSGVGLVDDPNVVGSISRCPDGVDTNVNNIDFVFTGITPGTENICTPPELAPAVSSTYPPNGSTSASKTDDIVITFNEPVTVTDPWFGITCTSSGTHTAVVTDADPIFTLNPETDFHILETCTVTILENGVNDDDLDDDTYDYMEADYIFTFSVAAGCGDPFTAIPAIQGTGHTSPEVGNVVTTEGVVVGDYQTNAYVSGTKNGFYIQSLAGDADPSTSDAIFVYSTMKDVVVGDHVRVTGTVAEYIPSGYTQSLTQLTSLSQILTCDTSITIDPTVFTLPVDSDLDFERHEGMLVTIPQELVISEYYNFGCYGEIKLTTERYMTYTAANEPDITGFADWNANLLLNSITLDDGRTSQNPDPAYHPNGDIFDMLNLFRGGDLVANVTGVFDHYYDLYRVQPLEGADYTAINTRPETVELVEGDLTVASFNVLNYFITLDLGPDICSPSGTMECRGADTAEELVRQRDKILAAMSEIDADIFGLMEIENDSPLGAGDAVSDLVEGLNDIIGAGTYDYIDTGAIGTDAIKQALLYKPATVTPVGDYQVLTSGIDPRFIDTLNRPVLAQVFEDTLTGETFTVVVNHLKSKGSSCDGDPDLLDGAGNCNLTRKAAAEAMVDWLENTTYFPDVENVLIIGDLNSYDKEDPIDMIKLGADDTADTDDDYFDMMYEIHGEEAYGYVFDGQMGYLDYAMANTALADNVADVNFWHINADEPSLIDYDMTYKLPAQDALYAPDAYRSSDHDPVTVTLTLNHPPLAEDDYYETFADQTLTVDAVNGVLANDNDEDITDIIYADLITGPSHGTLTLNADGSFEYIPDPGFFGEDSFVYLMIAVPEQRGQFSDEATVYITVHPNATIFLPLIFKN